MSGHSSSQLWWRLLGFAALPVVYTVVPFAAYPILARSISTDEWAALAVGHAIGGLGAILLAYGWSVTGPSEVAQAPQAGRSALLRESLLSRAAIAPFVFAAVTAASLSISVHGTRLFTLAVSAAVALQGMTIFWYAVGLGRPGIAIRYEAIPRAVGYLGGALAVALSGLSLLFPAVLALFQLLPWYVFWKRQIGEGSSPLTEGAVLGRLKKNRSAVGTAFVAGSYSIGAPAIVGAASAPAVTATFSSGERLTKFAAQGVAVVGTSMQGWVAEAQGRHFVRRFGASLAGQIVVGSVGACFLGFFGPAATRVLFGEELMIDHATGAALGIFYLLWGIETVLGRHVLAARGRLGALFKSTAVGSLCGIVGVYVGASQAGALGGAIGLAGAILVIVVLQAFAVSRIVIEEWRETD